MAVRSFLVKTATQRIIVDTGLGNDKQGRGVPRWNRLQTPFLQDIAAHGFAVETIDTVIATHLHVDHVGWNTRLLNGRWIPTFPNARYIWSGKEYGIGTRTGKTPMSRPFNDSIKPVVDAGLVDLVDSGHRFSNRDPFLPTAGTAPRI